MQTIRLSNVFYFGWINEIGGVETMFYELARKYCSRDITILYREGDPNQLTRLRRYVRVRKYNLNDKIICDKAFFNYTIDIINHIEANEYIQIIHADYLAQNLKPNIHHKFNRYIAVSQLAANSFTKLTGLPCEVCYNPFTPDDNTREVLRLISATRLTPEKGRDRIIKLGNLLDAHQIPYLWLIFTNSKNVINNPNIIYMSPRLNIKGYIKSSHYLVQLSDCESYCYSLVESLSLGTPVITTDLPVLPEMGINSSHGFMLPFDMIKVPVQEIYDNRGSFDFNYEPPEDRWGSILNDCRSTYKNDKVLVEALPIYQKHHIVDTELGRVPKLAERWYVSEERAEILLGHNQFNHKLVRVVNDE